MNLIIKSKKLKLTPRIKSYVTNKFSKYDKLLPYPTVLEIVLSEEPGRAGKKSQKIRLNCEIPRYKLIHMERSSEDVLASIDLIQRRFEQVVIRFRSKRLKPPRRVQIVRTMQEALTWVPRRLTGKKGRLAAKGPRIVKRKRFELTNKPMSEREAIEQMNLVNHDFYLFYNANTDRFSVIYKRKDGNYGIIEPKMKGEEMNGEESEPGEATPQNEVEKTIAYIKEERGEKINYPELAYPICLSFQEAGNFVVKDRHGRPFMIQNSESKAGLRQELEILSEAEPISQLQKEFKDGRIMVDWFEIRSLPGAYYGIQRRYDLAGKKTEERDLVAFIGESAHADRIDFKFY